MSSSRKRLPEAWHKNAWIYVKNKEDKETWHQKHISIWLVHEDLRALYPLTPNALLQLTDHSLRTPINWLSKMCRINGLMTPVCESWSCGWRWGKPPPMPAHNTHPSFTSSCNIATNLYPGHLRGLCFISLIWADSTKLLWGSALTANYRNLPRLLIENNGLRWASASQGGMTAWIFIHLIYIWICEK